MIEIELISEKRNNVIICPYCGNEAKSIISAPNMLYDSFTRNNEDKLKIAYGVQSKSEMRRYAETNKGMWIGRKEWESIKEKRENKELNMRKYIPDMAEAWKRYKESDDEKRKFIKELEQRQEEYVKIKNEISEIKEK